MAAAIFPIGNDDQRLEAPSNSAPKAALERRESERAIADWEKETIRLGRPPTLMTLNTAEMTSEKWAHRFIVEVDPIVENCVLLFYGDKFAAVLDLPRKPIRSIPMIHQLPPRFVPVFTRGCIEASSVGGPVRLQGAVERGDGRRELYRAVFIGFTVRPDGLSPLVFGTLNCRATDTRA
jgi:hypothetical protein